MRVYKFAFIFVCLGVTGCNQTTKDSATPAGAIRDALEKGCAFVPTLETAKEIADIVGIVVPYGDKITMVVDKVCSKVKAGAKGGTVEVTLTSKTGKAKTIVLERE